MLALALLGCLFLFFYFLTVKELPEPGAVRAWLATRGVCAACAAGCFAGAALLWGVLAAVPWAVFGWKLPDWVAETREAKRKARLAALARDFVAGAAGIYAAGLTTRDVLERMSERVGEPLASDLRDMFAERETADVTKEEKSVPAMFARLAKKYGLEEFNGVAKIISASEYAGGPQAAARGLKRLAQAMRQKERLAVERAKATIEPRIAAVVTIAILGAGLLLDGTLLRPYFAGGGRFVLAAASCLVVGMLFLMRRIGRSEDLV